MEGKVKIKVVISKDKLKYFALIFVCVIFFKPLAINSLPQYNLLNNLWDSVRVIVFLVLAAKILRYHRFSYMLTSVIVCHTLFLISTFVYEGNVKDLIVQTASVVGFCFLIQIEGRKDIERFYKALFAGLSILIILHTIFMILKPSGLGYDTVYYNSIYFLASKNGLSKFFFPAVVSGFVCYNFNAQKYKKRAISIAGLCIVLSIIVRSTTTVIGLIVCISLFWASELKRIKNISINVNKISLLVLVVALITSLVAFNGGLNAIVSLLLDTQKATNYLDRVVIWKKAISLIKKSPIIGYGMPYNGGHINVNGKYMYSHNGYLEFFLYGGIIGMLLCLYQLFFVLKARRDIKQNSICIPVVCGIIGFVIMMITESHVATIAYWGFFVMFEQLLDFEKNLNKRILIKDKVQ